MCPLGLEVPDLGIQLQGTFAFLHGAPVWYSRAFEVDKGLAGIEGRQHGIEEHLPAHFVEGLHEAVPVAVGVVRQMIGVAPHGDDGAGVAFEVVLLGLVPPPRPGIAQGRTETYYRSLPHYLMLHAVWHFNKNPKASSASQR